MERINLVIYQMYPSSYANDLNLFFNRFDSHDFSSETKKWRQTLCPGEQVNIYTTNEDEVRSHFKRLNSCKGSGPDKLMPRILKACADQLSYIFMTIFYVLAYRNYQISGRLHVLFLFQRSLLLHV